MRPRAEGHKLDLVTLSAEDYLQAYDAQLRTDAETPSAVAATIDIAGDLPMIVDRLGDGQESVRPVDRFDGVASGGRRRGRTGSLGRRRARPYGEVGR